VNSSAKSNAVTALHFMQCLNTMIQRHCANNHAEEAGLKLGSQTYQVSTKQCDTFIMLSEFLPTAVMCHNMVLLHHDLEKGLLNQ
jgi:hypothetical protein